MTRRSLLQTITAIALGICATLAQAQLFKSAADGPSVVTTERTRAELLVHAPDGLGPDKQVWLGLRLTHRPGWKSYWLNPGDAGLPTRLQWSLPRGVSAGEVRWPVPSKFLLGSLVNYGYAGTVLLQAPVRFSPEFSLADYAHSELEVKLKAQWLVCKDVCIPEEGELSLRIAPYSSHASDVTAFQGSWALLTREFTGSSRIDIEGTSLAVRVTGLPASLVGQKLDLFPETPGVIDASAPWSQRWDGSEWTARVPLSAQRLESPRTLPMVLTSPQGGWRTEAAVFGAWPAPGAVSTAVPAFGEAVGTPQSAEQRLTLGLALLGAFVGGLMLNLMPCVFPVLAIKVFGFARHGQDAAGRRVDGAAYAGGVVTSFVALGVVLVALRAAGEQVGWGFQLQSPSMVAALAVLFTIIGLNLAGVVTFGRLLPASWLANEARHRTMNAFLSGVLAVAVASPCTAPFMGAALGFAVAMPTEQALATFAALGLGMAMPYLVASWTPAAAKLLPRPGAWMDTFQRLLAFPMFATVVWLLWVLGKQTGIDALIATLALLVATSLLAWAASLRGTARATVGLLAVAALASTATVAFREIQAGVVAPPGDAQVAGWEAWNAGKVDSILATGRPVFVDFTAAWCVTCQYNKKTTLSDPAVQASFQARNVALLRADWTRREASITAALASFGRTGVPLYVLYSPGKPPQVLSELLTTAELTSALSGLPQ
ncbi:protein-disulfide reductase DsbD [Aquabacterium sp. J223]|uniref:protein-disulfide reductase DsbD family protein n=1 Tax=Aquabacterium sp. J223 TaxID=2898431 RepID=UPI0021AD71E1|nr:thioredoxin family protein [Aquabacterium sp. J223]UUX96644.1 thioredoxin family protein [Aquabacterium sp. J223]